MQELSTGEERRETNAVHGSAQASGAGIDRSFRLPGRRRTGKSRAAFEMTGDPTDDRSSGA
jgi:hypothetical protein